MQTDHGPSAGRGVPEAALGDRRGRDPRARAGRRCPTGAARGRDPAARCRRPRATAASSTRRACRPSRGRPTTRTATRLSYDVHYRPVGETPLPPAAQRTRPSRCWPGTPPTVPERPLRGPRHRQRRALQPGGAGAVRRTRRARPSTSTTRRRRSPRRRCGLAGARARARSSDDSSPVRQAEYSVDGGALGGGPSHGRHQRRPRGDLRVHARGPQPARGRTSWSCAPPTCSATSRPRASSCRSSPCPRPSRTARCDPRSSSARARSATCCCCAARSRPCARGLSRWSCSPRRPAGCARRQRPVRGRRSLPRWERADVARCCGLGMPTRPPSCETALARCDAARLRDQRRPGPRRRTWRRLGARVITCTTRSAAGPARLGLARAAPWLDRPRRRDRARTCSSPRRPRPRRRAHWLDRLPARLPGAPPGQRIARARTGRPSASPRLARELAAERRRSWSSRARRTRPPRSRCASAWRAVPADELPPTDLGALLARAGAYRRQRLGRHPPRGRRRRADAGALRAHRSRAVGADRTARCGRCGRRSATRTRSVRRRRVAADSPATSWVARTAHVHPADQPVDAHRHRPARGRGRARSARGAARRGSARPGSESPSSSVTADDACRPAPPPSRRRSCPRPSSASACGQSASPAACRGRLDASDGNSGLPSVPDGGHRPVPQLGPRCARRPRGNRSASRSRETRHAPPPAGTITAGTRLGRMSGRAAPGRPEQQRQPGAAASRPRGGSARARRSTPRRPGAAAPASARARRSTSRKRAPHASHDAEVQRDARASSPAGSSPSRYADSVRTDRTAPHEPFPSEAGERLAQRLARPRQPALDRPLGQPERLGDLAARQLLHLAQQQDRAVVERQPQQRRLDARRLLAPREPLRPGHRVGAAASMPLSAAVSSSSGRACRGGAAATSAAGCGTG